jgi:broad specificity phosphatase PhoE
MGYRLVLWRHGQTPWNQQRRFQGHSDVELDATGHQQAAAAAETLAQIAPDAIVSSDLLRAQQTAAALSRLTGIAATVDADLRETGASSWEGLTHDEIMQRDGDQFRRWLLDPATRPGGDGETATEVGQRAAAAVDRHLAALDPGSTLVVVTHGGSARALTGQLLDWPLTHWRRIAVLGNCSWAELRHGPDGRWLLMSHNQGAA